MALFAVIDAGIIAEKTGQEVVERDGSNMTHIIILRGISGAGKSTMVEKISKDRKYKDVFICSSDHYFMKDGQYKYNPDKIIDAHNYCMRRFLMELPNNHEAIFVDNTNIQMWHFMGYVQVAQALGCTIEIVEVKRDLKNCVRENIHGVPLVCIEAMNKLWEESPAWITVNKFWNIQKSFLSVDK
jgi:predicted kinase